jgi:hypothetical protein
MASSSSSSKLPPLEIPKEDVPRPRAASGSKPKSVADPVLRNALRYTISAREYETLHKYVISRSRLLRKRAPTVNTIEKYMDGDTSRRRDSVTRETGKGKGKESVASRAPGRRGGDTYNARAIRHALRVFVLTGLGAKAYESLMARLKGQNEYVHSYIIIHEQKYGRSTIV